MKECLHQNYVTSWLNPVFAHCFHIKAAVISQFGSMALWTTNTAISYRQLKSTPIIYCTKYIPETQIFKLWVGSFKTKQACGSLPMFSFILMNLLWLVLTYSFVGEIKILVVARPAGTIYLYEYQIMTPLAFINVFFFLSKTKYCLKKKWKRWMLPFIYTQEIVSADDLSWHQSV